MTSADDSSQAAPASPPAPLVVAVSLAAIEGLILICYGVAELANFNSARAALALTTSAFMLLYGGGLLACAWSVFRLNSWGRSPIVLAQLIQLGVATSFWSGSTRLVSVALALTALVTVIGILHPASITALAEDSE